MPDQPFARRLLTAALIAFYLAQVAIAAPTEPQPEPPPQPGGGTDGPRYPEGTVVKSDAPIMLPGNAGVSDAGGASYALPLLVPDGPQGMQPALSIDYGGRGNGSLGVGFHLSGLSAITPCGKTPASEGYADNVDFGIGELAEEGLSDSSPDAYCLDGQKLVPHHEDDFVPPLPGYTIQYHTEHESFVHVVAYRTVSTSAQPDKFTATSRDGTIRTYMPMYGTLLTGAEDSQSKLRASTQQVALIYVVTEAVDKNGNRIVYSYDHADALDATESAYRLIRIQYSYNGSLARRSLELRYKTRNDPIVRFVRGVKVVSRSLLEKIEAYAPNPTAVQKVWTYHLGYIDSHDTGRSLLETVQLCDQFTACSWIRSFRYTDRPHAPADQRVVSDVEFGPYAMSYDQGNLDAYNNDPSANWLPGTDVRVMLYDIDGDGDDDALYRTGRSWVRGVFEIDGDSGYLLSHLWQRNKEGAIMVRLSAQDQPLGLMSYDVSQMIEPWFDNATIADGDSVAFANLGASRIADLDGDGRLDLLLARTRLTKSGATPDPTNSDYTFEDSWEYGFRTYYGKSFDHFAEYPFDPGIDDLDEVLIHGPILKLSDYGGSLRLAKPPFQRIVADLDGDARPEIVDAIEGNLDSEDPPGVDWSDPYSYFDVGSFNYHTTLSSDGSDQLFGETWTCGNGRASVADLDADGRDDVLVAGDALSSDPALDPIMGSPSYRRLSMSDPWSGSGTHGNAAVGSTTKLWGGGCSGDIPDLVMGDWNGDGLEDALYLPHSYGNNTDALVRWNIGRGFGPVESFGVTGGPGVAALLEQPVPVGKLHKQIAWDRGTRVADVDGDGRSDLVAFRQDNAQCIDPVLAMPIAPPVWGCENKLVVFRSRGDHFEGEEVISWSKGGASLAQGFTMDQIGDVDGDGAIDAVYVNAGKLTITRLPWHETPDLLESVHDGGSGYALDTFAYTRAWWGDQPRNEASPTSPTGPAPCAWPVACPNRGFTVARQHLMFRGTRPDGTPMWNSTYHKYSQPRVSLIGRGSLGFHTHTIWDRERGRGEHRVYTNTAEVDPVPGIPGGVFYPDASPYAGRPDLVVEVTPRHPAPTDAELASSDIGPGLAANVFTDVRTRWSSFAEQLRNDASGRILTALPTYSKVSDVENTAVPWLSTKTPEWASTSWVGNGPTTTTTSEFDAYGNLTERLIEIGAGIGVPRVTRAFKSTYDNRVATWQLGLPARAVERSYDVDDATKPARVLRTTYDAKGNLETIDVNALDGVTLCPPGDPLVCEQRSTKTELVHDAQGNVTDAISTAHDDPVPHAVHVAWDPDGVYPFATTDALGFTTQTIIHPALGVPIVETSVEGVTTVSTYDGFGRMRGATRPATAALIRNYSEIIQGTRHLLRVDTELADGSKSYDVNDELGRVVDSARLGFAGWTYDHNAFDVYGNRTGIARPELVATPAAWTVSAYDRLGQPLATTTPDGATRVFEPGLLETASWDPEGHETYVQRDVAGRITESGHRINGGTSYGALRFDYGPFDVAERVIDADDNEIVRAYDPFGRLTREDHPDTGVTTTTYDGFGQVVSEKRANGDTFEHHYDALGRRTTSDGPDGTTVRTYDTGPGAARKIATMTSPDGVATAFGYDTYGRIHQLDQTVDGVTRSIVHRYDSYGRIRYLFYPEVTGFDRFTLAYSYGTDGDLRELRDATVCHLSTAQDASDLPCAPPKLWQITGRNARGSLTSAKFGNNVTVSRGYDANTGRLESVSAPSATIGYEYDLDGQVTRRFEPSTDRNEKFAYDELHRLTAWTLTGGKRRDGGTPPTTTTAYEYDELGNLERVEVEGTPTFGGSYGFAGTQPHVLATSTVGGAYAYDASGRQLTGDGRVITWSQFDLPRSITTMSSVRFFRYDAAGQRVTREDATGKITYFARLFEHREALATGVLDTFLIYGEPGLVAQVDYGPSGKTTRYVVGDPIDNAALVIKSSGAIDERAYFDPFGARIDADGASIGDPVASTSFGFTGHEEDGDGLINMQGRIYDRRQYRFLTADPIVDAKLFGQDYNPYSYVDNNPVVLNDPSGYQDHDPATFDEQPYTPVKEYPTEGGTVTVSRRGTCGTDGGCTDPEPESGGADGFCSDDEGSDGDTAQPDAGPDLDALLQQAERNADAHRRSTGEGGAPSQGDVADAFSDLYYESPTWDQKMAMRRTFTGTPEPDIDFREPDFISGSFGFGPITPSITIDRHFQIYFGIGGVDSPWSLFKPSKWSFGGGVYGGWLLQDRLPDDDDMSSFLSEWSTGVEGGYIVGGGMVFADGRSSKAAVEFGLRSPGASAGRAYSWNITEGVKDALRVYGESMLNGGMTVGF